MAQNHVLSNVSCCVGRSENLTFSYESPWNEDLRMRKFPRKSTKCFYQKSLDSLMCCKLYACKIFNEEPLQWHCIMMLYNVVVVVLHHIFRWPFNTYYIFISHIILSIVKGGFLVPFLLKCLCRWFQRNRRWYITESNYLSSSTQLRY